MIEATSVINEISGGLDQLANQVVATFPDERTMLEMWGWTQPAINKHEIAEIVRSPKDIISKIDSSTITSVDLDLLKIVPQRLQLLIANVVPNMPGGNSMNGYTSIISVISYLSSILMRYAPEAFDVAEIEGRKLLPGSQIKRLKTVDLAISRLEFEQTAVAGKIDEINKAQAVAEALPANMQLLDEARQSYEDSRGQFEKSSAAVLERRREADEAIGRLKLVESEADAILIRANKAYSAATTIGLGKEFSLRAKNSRRPRGYWERC